MAKLQIGKGTIRDLIEYNSGVIGCKGAKGINQEKLEKVVNALWNLEYEPTSTFTRSAKKLQQKIKSSKEELREYIIQLAYSWGSL